MLAGASGIDLVLLVVAADESVRPQTREHFHICRLLGLSRGVIALTKSDLAGPELAEVAREEVRAFVAGSFLESAPIVLVSSRTREGIPELIEALAAAARRNPGASRAGSRAAAGGPLVHGQRLRDGRDRHPGRGNDRRRRRARDPAARAKGEGERRRGARRCGPERARGTEDGAPTCKASHTTDVERGDVLAAPARSKRRRCSTRA
jgi:hypothetical protein